MNNDTAYRSLLRTIQESNTITILTGAGVSAESGLPTYRDKMTGLWANYNFRDLATLEAFQKNPCLVAQWYAMRRKAAQKAIPNAGHRAIFELSGHKSVALITQNVDGLHQRAGNTDAIELHGNLLTHRCHYCKESVIEDSEPFPQCVTCGCVARPNVVWFGEPIPEAALTAAAKAAQNCDLFLSIGTSGTVHPAASLISNAAIKGAVTAVINKDRTDNAQPDTIECIGSAGDILSRIVRDMFE